MFISLSEHFRAHKNFSSEFILFDSLEEVNEFSTAVEAGWISIQEIIQHTRTTPHDFQLLKKRRQQETEKVFSFFFSFVNLQNSQALSLKLYAKRFSLVCFCCSCLMFMWCALKETIVSGSFHVTNRVIFKIIGTQLF